MSAALKRLPARRDVYVVDSDRANGNGAADATGVVVRRIADVRALAAARGLRLHGDVVDLVAAVVADLALHGELGGAEPAEHHADDDLAATQARPIARPGR